MPNLQLLLACLFALGLAKADKPKYTFQSYVTVKVELPGGASLRGSVEKSRTKERTYFAFRAIPYAQPPVGDNRFMPTLPGYEWEGIFDATQKGEPCAQAGMGIMTGKEDCLNLYVYTPK
ncbi:Carboxylesterase 5A, partial [Halocaridina rubra]